MNAPLNGKIWITQNTFGLDTFVKLNDVFKLSDRLSVTKKDMYVIIRVEEEYLITTPLAIPELTSLIDNM